MRTAHDDNTRLAGQLSQRTPVLDDTQERLEELLYVASHDLTEPLRMVRSFLGLLERHNGEDLDDRGREYLAHASAGADRLQALVDDLLRYSRLETATGPLVPVDLGTALEVAISGLGHQLAAEDATVSVERTLPVVDGDPAQLAQLLQNLVANAAKFHPAERGNRITISAERDEDGAGWVLRVTDDGIGIADRQADRIFAPFQRLHPQGEYEGNGIGLAICRRIARRRGGDVTVAPRPGGGSVFTVAIPDAGELR